jgi:hypothetical protein
MADNNEVKNDDEKKEAPDAPPPHIKFRYFTQPGGVRRTYVFATTYNRETHELSIGCAVHRPDTADDHFTRRKHGESHQTTAEARLRKRPVVIQYERMVFPAFPDNASEAERERLTTKYMAMATARKINMMRKACVAAAEARKREVHRVQENERLAFANHLHHEMMDADAIAVDENLI